MSSFFIKRLGLKNKFSWVWV